MPVGLQVWDASGRSVIDTVTQVPIILGSIAATSAGSITNPLFTGKSPFYFCYSTSPDSLTGAFSIEVANNFRIVGDTLFWDWTPPPNRSIEVVIVYGVY